MHIQTIWEEQVSDAEQFMVMLIFNDIVPELNSAEGNFGIWAVREPKCWGFCLKARSVCGVVSQGKEAWPQQTHIL